MITEDYVSFETAKLLKEKGFDGSCYKVWESHGDSQTLVGASWFVEGETVVNRESVDAASKQYVYEYNLNNNVEGYLAPSIQMVMKWLRENKGIAIVPIVSSVLDNEKFLWDIKIIVAKTNETYMQGWVYESYENACEKAIKYCLGNLI